MSPKIGAEEPEEDNPLDGLFSRARDWVSDTLNTHPPLEDRRRALEVVRSRLEQPVVKRPPSKKPRPKPRKSSPPSSS